MSLPSLFCSVIWARLTHWNSHFFGSLNLGANNEMLRASVQVTQAVAQQLKLPCPWQAEDVVEEFRFLDKVMRP